MEEGQDIQHPFITRAIATAQKRVEGHNFEIRKHLLEYDNVMNRQREVIYDERRRVLFGEDLKKYAVEILEEVVEDALDTYLNEKVSFDRWDFEGLRLYLDSHFSCKTGSMSLEEKNRDEIRDAVLGALKEAYDAKEKSLGGEMMRHLERMILLQVVDTRWKDHLYAMDNLREGIGLRAYGQRDPLVEYQHEGYGMFQEMIARIKEETLEFLFKIRAVSEEAQAARVFDVSRQQIRHDESSQFQFVPQLSEEGRSAAAYEGDAPPPKEAPYKREAPKVGRNDPCPCGSGKKYKKCCGR